MPGLVKARKRQRFLARLENCLENPATSEVMRIWTYADSRCVQSRRDAWMTLELTALQGSDDLRRSVSSKAKYFSGNGWRSHPVGAAIDVCSHSRQTGRLGYRARDPVCCSRDVTGTEGSLRLVGDGSL
jgi:hypothetical protein